jgi:hypothetical protein
MLRCSIDIQLELLLGLHVGVFLVHSLILAFDNMVNDGFLCKALMIFELLTVFRLLTFLMKRGCCHFFYIVRKP